jgi:hypothetical protein
MDLRIRRKGRSQNGEYKKIQVIRNYCAISDCRYGGIYIHSLELECWSIFGCILSFQTYFP